MVEPMRILQFVPYFVPYLGGQEKYVYNLSKYLVKMGHEVHVITSNFPKSKNFEEIEGITVERYKPIVRPLRNPIVLKFLRVPRRFKNFDIVHIHNEHAFSSMIAAFAKRKQNFPLVLTNHGKLIFGRYIEDRIERVYLKYIGKKIFELSDIIVVNSKSDKNFISSIVPKSTEKIYIFHNAIDIGFLSKRINYVTGEEFEYDGSDFKILYVGALIKRKGIEWLIKAMKIVKEEMNKKVKCILVGEGQDRNYFERLVRKYNLSKTVIFAGKISDEKLIWLYKNSNIFVLPSLSEGCSTSILEAMYIGLPVIATDIPGNRDHFKDVAILVPPKDENILADAIVKLLNDEELAKHLSIIGKNLVKSKYRWDVLAKKYNKLYEELLNRVSCI